MTALAFPAAVHELPGLASLLASAGQLLIFPPALLTAWRQGTHTQEVLR